MGAVFTPEVLKFLGFGGATGAVLFGGFMVWLLLRVKSNKSRVRKLETRCNGQDQTLIKHGRQLTKIETCVGHLESGQEAINGKIDRLIDIHLNGGK